MKRIRREFAKMVPPETNLWTRRNACVLVYLLGELLAVSLDGHDTLQIPLDRLLPTKMGTRPAPS